MSRGAKTGKPISASAKHLAENANRLLRLTPKDARQQLRKALPASTWRTVTKSIKSATLRTVDDLAALLDAPAWMLIHPDMKRWDQNREWIEHIIRVYIEADPQSKELFHSVVRSLDRKHPLPKKSEPVT